MGHDIPSTTARYERVVQHPKGHGDCCCTEPGKAPAPGVLPAPPAGASAGVVSFRGAAGDPGRGFLTDLSRSASKGLGELLILLLRLYRAGISPVLPSSCRFYPSCSCYVEEALRRHGVLRGLWLGAWRILRCGPWSEGGYDPVPLE